MTILTDDEIDAICERVRETHGHTFGALIAKATESAVLAKLREQEPVAWMQPRMPEKMRGPATRTAEAYGFVNGWNACVDAIKANAAPMPAVVQASQGLDVQGRRIAAEAENHACSLAVWMTRMDAESPGADDLGVSGWLQEAERRIKRRMLATVSQAQKQPKEQA